MGMRTRFFFFFFFFFFQIIFGNSTLFSLHELMFAFQTMYVDYGISQRSMERSLAAAYHAKRRLID